MSFVVEFPEPEEENTVETELMRRTLRRTLAVHRGGAIVVWTGPSRIGKTRTAEWAITKLEEAYGSSPYAFKARHYEVGGVAEFSGNEGKRAIRSLYHATVGTLSEHAYKQLPIEDLAALLVRGLKARNVQLVFVDEAGLLSLPAIRGMILVRDTAELMGWCLSLVFIGMDDLPTKIRTLPQIRNRVHEWCYFQPYGVDETFNLLGALHPHFRELRRDVAAEWVQVEFVHQQFGGLPGLIVPFLRRLALRHREMNIPIELDFLRAVHIMSSRDEERAIIDEGTGYESPAGDASDIANPAELTDAPPVRRRRRDGARPAEADGVEPNRVEPSVAPEPGKLSELPVSADPPDGLEDAA